MARSANRECRFRRLTALLFALGSLASRPCWAEPKAESSASEPRPSLWKDTWPQFSLTEGILTLSAGVGTAALAFAPAASEARVSGGVLFDDGVRRALRADGAGARRTFRSIGDNSYYAAPILPLVIDSLVVGLLVRRDSKAAANMALLSAEAFSYTGLVTFSALRGVARERPDSSECRRSSPDPSHCKVDTESFYSGHSAVTATAAGLTCANHTRMPLWGHPIADASACGLAVATSLLTGTTRMIADRHYPTDVLTGLSIGFGVGYAVPVLLHFSRTKQVKLALTSDPGCPGCLALRGIF